MMPRILIQSRIVSKITFYSIVAAFVLVLDRVTKLYALHHWQDEHIINPYLLFQVTFNRGISWGLFNYGHATFIILSSLIALLTLGLFMYASKRLYQGKTVLGEVLVISGSFSNLIDRFLYHGVVDFIVMHKDQWIWPSFNVADSCIVLGIFIMFLQLLQEHA